MDLLHLTMSLSLVMEPLLSGQFLALPESLAFTSRVVLQRLENDLSLLSSPQMFFPGWSTAEVLMDTGR